MDKTYHKFVVIALNDEGELEIASQFTYPMIKNRE